MREQPRRQTVRFQNMLRANPRDRKTRAPQHTVNPSHLHHILRSRRVLAGAIEKRCVGESGRIHGQNAAPTTGHNVLLPTRHHAYLREEHFTADAVPSRLADCYVRAKRWSCERKRTLGIMHAAVN